jgi:hypothetical protein
MGIAHQHEDIVRQDSLRFVRAAHEVVKVIRNVFQLKHRAIPLACKSSTEARALACVVLAGRIQGESIVGAASAHEEEGEYEEKEFHR